MTAGLVFAGRVQVTRGPMERSIGLTSVSPASFFDLDLRAFIAWDGDVWRDAVTGAVV